MGAGRPRQTFGAVIARTAAAGDDQLKPRIVDQVFAQGLHEHALGQGATKDLTLNALGFSPQDLVQD